MEQIIIDDEIWLCKLLYNNLQLPVRLLKTDGTVDAVFDSVDSAAAHPLDPNSDTLIAGIFEDDSPCDVPCYSTLNGFDQYVWLRFGEMSGHTGAIVIGPAISSLVTDEILEGFLFDYSLSGVHFDSLREYYKQLPMRYQKSMLHAGTLLYYLIYRRPLDITEVVDCSVRFLKTHALNEELERSLMDRRLSMNLHDQLQAGKMLLQWVKEGRKEELFRYRDLFSMENRGILSRKSRLRNEKNLAICLVTHTMQAAIDGGLYPEVAFNACDLWIQHIEDLNDTEEVSMVMQEVLFDFAERVNRQRMKQSSKPILVCQDYIFNRIYEPIKLTELADVAGVHPAYLSKLFKQETGMTVTEYIQQQKIEEAKKLLTLSDASPLRAASLLNFHDQSHFTKVFKKYTGVTPKQYKNHAV